MRHFKQFILFLFLTLITAGKAAFSEGLNEGTTLETRNRYQASRGMIVPSQEIVTDLYVASFNYQYPDPENQIKAYFYNQLGKMGGNGQEGLLQIGIQGKNLVFSELPPLNLVFAVDTSSSMNDDDKIAWIKESLVNFTDKTRPGDSLALVSFNDSVNVLFQSARMDSPEKRRQFVDAVNSLNPKGGTQLESGMKAGYEQAVINNRKGAVNLVLLFSDGTDLSERLARGGAHSGDIRISLIWNNRNDLDLHVITPKGEEIFFDNLKDSTGGWLDVDRNVYGETTEPVENVFWYEGNALHGEYRVYIQNYDYHESDYGPTPFQVEIKNGDELNYYDGIIRGYGNNSNTEVSVFEYPGKGVLAQIYQQAENYRAQGIAVSTLGIGGSFDEQLMRALAQHGRGNSRTLNNREAAKEILANDREFGRIAVHAAEDLEMRVAFTEGIEILDAWGLEYQIDRNLVSFQIPAIHQADYKTLLVRYRLPPLFAGKKSASFYIRAAADTEGENFVAQSGEIALTNEPDAAASKALQRSEAMLNFADSLKEIGNIYYSTAEIADRLGRALALTRQSRLDIEDARLSLKDTYAFTPELEILSRYDEILMAGLTERGVHTEPFAPRIAEPVEVPIEEPPIPVTVTVYEEPPIPVTVTVYEEPPIPVAVTAYEEPSAVEIGPEPRRTYSRMSAPAANTTSRMMID
ncbi:MAG: VWA domain-containing protein [Treponema sp.]|jgi:Ca-activated chloride channel family protein|nr:VWA domain-containing protein [Treponema sp.]